VISVIKLRKSEPTLIRPFKVPLYPAFPLIALTIAVFSFIAMTIFNPGLAGIYILILLICFIAFKTLYKKDSIIS
jgi:ethanolamine permease